MSRLKRKAIVIIGGTAGMGLSAACACVAEGASVVAVGRDPDVAAAARRQLGRRAVVLTGDATDPATAPDAIREALRRFGRFDGIYHVAGGSGRKMGDGPLHEISDEGWRFTIDLNLSALFYSNRAAIQQFIQQGTGGAILNLGSILGVSPSPGYFSTHAYAAAKAAAIGMTRSAAAFYASRNIRLNLLLPALIETPMSQRAVNNLEIMEFIRSKQPLEGGRVGQPADLDGAVVYFLSDESRFVTGQVLAVDGGWSVTEGQLPRTKSGGSLRKRPAARARRAPRRN